MSHAGSPNHEMDQKKTNGKLSVRKIEPKVKFAPSPLSSVSHEDRPKPKIACVTPTLQAKEKNKISGKQSRGGVVDLYPY